MSSSSPFPYKIRRVSRDEIPSVKCLCDVEGWRISLDYLQTGFDLCPGGWWAAEDNHGELIGLCTGTAIDTCTASIGLYIVRENCRRRGLGTSLWRAVREFLKQRNINITAFKPEIYERDGFRRYPYQLKFMQGPVDHSMLAACSCEEDFSIEFVKRVSLDNILDYDKTVHIIPRTKFLRKWILHDDAVVLVASIKQSGSLLGYGAVRPLDRGWCVYPLYADEYKVAMRLMATLLNSVPVYNTIRFYATTGNPRSIELARTAGLQYVKESTPMYSEMELKFPLHKLYSISTIDFTLI